MGFRKLQATDTVGSYQTKIMSKFILTVCGSRTVHSAYAYYEHRNTPAVAQSRVREKIPRKRYRITRVVPSQHRMARYWMMTVKEISSSALYFRILHLTVSSLVVR